MSYEEHVEFHGTQGSPRNIGGESRGGLGGHPPERIRDFSIFERESGVKNISQQGAKFEEQN